MTRFGAPAILGRGVAAASCDGVLGIREYDGNAAKFSEDASDSTNDSAPSTCGINAGSPSCGACIHSSCCQEAKACAQSSACSPYEDCLIPCGTDYACRSRCLIADYANAAEISALDQCVAAQCSDQCGLACNTNSLNAEPDAAAACERCITANACSGAAECSTRAECGQLLQCGVTCMSQDCLWGCYEREDAGILLIASYGEGMESCASACGLGEFWDCPLGAEDGGLGFDYFVNAVLTPAATSTDFAGFAVLLNTPARTQLTVSVTPLAAARETSAVRIFARRGAASYVDVHPR